MTYEATVLTTAGDVAQFKAGAVVLLQGQSALDVPVNFSVATSKLTVNASTGAAVFAGAVSGITTLAMTGAAGIGAAASGTVQLTVTRSGGSLANFTQTSATGYGITIIPGADTTYDALTINNAANTLNKIRMFGDGSITAGAISGTTGTFNNSVILTAGTLFAAGNTGFSHRSADNVLYLQMPSAGMNITDNALNTKFGFSSTGLSVTGGVTANSPTGTPNLDCEDVDNQSGHFFLAMRKGDATVIGSITRNAGTDAVLFNTTSDYRIKDIHGKFSGATEMLNQIVVHDGNFKGSAQRQPLLIAHEVQAITPWAVTGEKDATNADGTPLYQQLATGSHEALLIAGFQELATRLAALEAK